MKKWFKIAIEIIKEELKTDSVWRLMMLLLIVYGGAAVLITKVMDC